MKKIAGLAAVLCLCVLLLTGCGEMKLPDIIDEPTVSIDAEGKITLWLVGDFGSNDYNLSELTEKAVEEVSLFNAEKDLGQGAVTVQNVEALQGGRVVVTYNFDGWESCTQFIGDDLFYGTDELFYGTVDEALERGYDSKVIMRSVKDNTLLTGEQLKQESNKYLIVTNVKANIYCSGKVSHISDGAEMNEDGSINTSGTEGLVYILLR